jgi:hypothetical protein
VTRKCPSNTVSVSGCTTFAWIAKS